MDLAFWMPVMVAGLVSGASSGGSEIGAKFLIAAGSVLPSATTAPMRNSISVLKTSSPNSSSADLIIYIGVKPLV